MSTRARSTLHNPVSLFGLTIASFALILILVLIVIDLASGFASAYTGLLTYIALPGAMFFGLFITSFGVWRERRRRRRGEEPAPMPVLDLNVPKQRRIVTAIGLAGLFMMALSGFGSYHAYEYTESVQFCGTTCHNVMEPEYTTYQASPHARVTCTGCHIGAGVDWYVKSKLSGAYQVYSTLFNKYDRPIKTPVTNLRPAKETCEQCHWPKHFFAQKMRTYQYFMSDEDNTPHEISMLVKVGGGEGTGADGIHAHMYLDSQISYIATDRERQKIPYVEVLGKDGTVTVYRDKSVASLGVPKGERRVVDCIECHNRPTHIFQTPDRALNQALSKGQMDRTLPDLKSTAFEALEGEYKTKQTALVAIEKAIRDYYKETYPEVATSKSKEISNAIQVVQAIYSQNYFPEMRTDWKSHRNNLDHLHNMGCFRCHDGQHVSDKGKVIGKDCSTCHTFVRQGAPGSQANSTIGGQPFIHPVDIGDDWKTTPCMECHGPDQPE